MHKSTIVIIIYIIGLIFGALVLDMWSANTSPKALLGIGWTALLLIGLFLQKKMKKINYLSFFILILITLTNSNRLSAEIIILKFLQ